MRRWVNKWVSVALTAVMLTALAPWTGGGTTVVKAAEDYPALEYKDVLVNQVKILHQGDWYPEKTYSYDDEDEGDIDTSNEAIAINAFRWFSMVQSGQNLSGVSIIDVDGDLDGGPHLGDADILEGTINVAQIPELKRLAEGEGEFRVYVRSLYESDDDAAEIEVHSKTLGNVLKKDNGKGEDEHFTTGWVKLKPDDLIYIRAESWGSGTVTGIHVNFRDITPPSVKDYTFTSDGTERDNTQIGEKELFLKKDEKLQLAYPFSEPLKADIPSNDLQSHNLFTNVAGTGLPGAGINQSMKLDAAIDLGGYVDSLSYTYNAADYHSTGNLPIANGGDLDSLTGSSLNESSLKHKIAEAGFHDAAGNPLQLNNFGKKASSQGAVFLQGKAVNPFDETADAGLTSTDGYRVIIDAVPPKYTFTANGIQPEIVTGSTLNKGDVIDFTVNLTEDAVVKEGWQPEGLYLLLNNGTKAFYVSGSNSKVWKFRATISADDTDVSLVKAIALTHVNKLPIDSTAEQVLALPDKGDTGVIQDYAGNLLMDSANAMKGEAVTDPSQAVPNTSIAWAKLAIDNTKPQFTYTYEADGATAAVYGKKGKVTIKAKDPSVAAPPLDPDEPGAERPSRGIYRPINMTGINPDEDSPGVGLVYYYWSRNADNPLAGKEEDRFAALKRYSLTGLQPQNDLYPGELDGFSLMVAHNETNSIAPPAEALLAENSGPWYLHTWTADMTWETARELMQYDKMKAYKTAHAAEYEGWIADYKTGHPDASDADAESYANTEALKKVGNYKDQSVWALADFKHDDSNWIYDKAVLKLDNTLPVMEAAAASGDRTSVVTVPIAVTDAHSGIDSNGLFFQWVKPGGAADDGAWKEVPADHAVTTLGSVMDDGEYELLVKAADKAGNVALFNGGQTVVGGKVTVNSYIDIEAQFSPGADSAAYVRSHDITFSVKGIQPAALDYAFSASAARPKAYTSVTGAVYSGSVNEAVYKAYIPSDHALDGDVYLHVRAKDKGQQNYYFSKLYYFDNTPPGVEFDLAGVTYPKTSHSVVASVYDAHNGTGLTTRYQWLKAGESPPLPGSSGWQQLPPDGKVTILNTALEKGQTTEYVLYVLAADSVGNQSVVRTKGGFQVTREDDTPVVVSGSHLIYIAGDAISGYDAILRLELDKQSKEGYEYAISTDDGRTWGPWLPYTNFVKVRVASGNKDQLAIKAKFKSPANIMSDAVAVDTVNYSRTEPIYAIATHNTLKAVKADGGLKLAIGVSSGIKVTPDNEANPAQPIRLSGNTFSVTRNGLYTFKLTDALDSARTDKLLVVVKNIDTQAPQGTIAYSTTQTTGANVRVRLDTSEPVRIVNNGGSATRIFTDNGSFTFEFEDEAGNSGSATAVVANIDRVQPQARIVQSYAYGDNLSKAFKTVEDADGRVLLSEGVTLLVEKASSSAKNFISLDGSLKRTLRENGNASFTIADTSGNTAVLEDEVTNIVADMPDPQIEYTFVDDAGNALADSQIVTIGGKRYAKGKIKATLRGSMSSNNQAFAGTVPVLDESGHGYRNLISDSDGRYAYSATYSTDGERRVAISDRLGHVKRVVAKVEGLDNTPPTLVLKSAYAAVSLNKPDFDAYADLGGYTVSDNVSASGSISVTVEGLDLTVLGKHTVTYRATDEVGNVTIAKQTVVVLPTAGLLIAGNGEIISSALGQSVLFDRNTITFDISGYNVMDVEGQSRVNEEGSYDLLYYNGLYREGQMKTIASRITKAELLNNQFKVTFPETGWYTIIVRTQEREREFATFFIGKIAE